MRSDRPLADDIVRAVAERVGAAFLSAFIVDSDFAEVLCAAPGQATFDFVLHSEIAAGYEYPVDPEAQEAAVPRLLRWAGGDADETILRAAVDGCLTFAEDSVMRLAAGIGAIPPADLADWTFGSIEDNHS